MTVVLDTCALFWWTAMPEKLSPAAAAACATMEQDGGMVSSISFWELGIKARKGTIALGVSIETFCERVVSTGILEILPVDLDTWLANLALDWEHRDPADRTIVAAAMRRDAPIVTADTVIADYYPDVIW